MDPAPRPPPPPPRASAMYDAETWLARVTAENGSLFFIHDCWKFIYTRAAVTSLKPSDVYYAEFTRLVQATVGSYDPQLHEIWGLIDIAGLPNIRIQDDLTLANTLNCQLRQITSGQQGAYQFAVILPGASTVVSSTNPLPRPAANQPPPTPVARADRGPNQTPTNPLPVPTPSGPESRPREGSADSDLIIIEGTPTLSIAAFERRRGEKRRQPDSVQEGPSLGKRAKTGGVAPGDDEGEPDDSSPDSDSDGELDDGGDDGEDFDYGRGDDEEETDVDRAVEDAEAQKRAQNAFSHGLLAHMDEELMDRTNTMFLAPPQERQSDYEYRVRGFSTSLRPYQALTIRRMFEQEHECNGMLLGHEMGAGKTITMLAFFILVSWYRDNGRRVNYYREIADPHHHPLNQPPGSGCPQQRFVPFQCRCVTDGVMAELRVDSSASEADDSDTDGSVYATPPPRTWGCLPTVRAGVQLIVVPRGLIPTWRRDFGQLMNRTQAHAYSPVHLWVAHGSCKADDGLPGQPLPPKDSTLWLEMYSQGASEANCHDHAHRHIILTTTESFDSQVARKFFTTTTTHHRTKPAGRARKGPVATTVNGEIFFGRLARDEQHMNVAANSPTPWLLSRQSARQGVKLAYYGLSGTLTKNGPRGLKWCVDYMRDPVTWPRSSTLRDITAEAVDELIVEYDMITGRKKRDRQIKVKDLVAFKDKMARLFAPLVIAIDAETLWWDRMPCIPLSPNVHRTVLLRMSRKYRALQSVTEGALASSVQDSHRRRILEYESSNRRGDPPEITVDMVRAAGNSRIARSCANVPYFNLYFKAGYRLVQKELPAGADNSSLPGGVWGQKRIRQDLAELRRSSPKIRFIAKVAHKLKRAKRNQEEEKLVVLADNLWELEVCRRYLKSKNYRVELVYPTLTDKDREALFDRFCDTKADNQETLLYPNIANRPQILLGTIKTLGRGYNLQRANHLIVMGPQWFEDDLRQALKRVVRPGQARVSYTWLLLDESTAIDTMVFRRSLVRQFLTLGTTSGLGGENTPEPAGPDDRATVHSLDGESDGQQTPPPAAAATTPGDLDSGDVVPEVDALEHGGVLGPHVETQTGTGVPLEAAHDDDEETWRQPIQQDHDIAEVLEINVRIYRDLKMAFRGSEDDFDEEMRQTYIIRNPNYNKPK